MTARKAKAATRRKCLRFMILVSFSLQRGHFWRASAAPVGSTTIASVPLRMSARGSITTFPPSESAFAARAAGSSTRT